MPAANFHWQKSLPDWKSNASAWQDKCTKRDQELRLLAKDKSKSRSVLEGSVVLAPMPDKITADRSTPLLQLQFDLMQVVSWKTHERWLNFLLQSLATEGLWASFQSLLKANSDIFFLASKEVSQVRPEAGAACRRRILASRCTCSPCLEAWLVLLKLRTLFKIFKALRGPQRRGEPPPKRDSWPLPKRIPCPMI